MQIGRNNRFDTLAQSIHQTIDLTAALLLLTGQITIRSVIITTDAEFRITVAGPLFGYPRTVARPEVPGAALVIDALDVVVAFLLILGELNTLGVTLQSQRFALIISGRAFGSEPTVGYTPSAQEFYSDFRKELIGKHLLSKQ